MPSKALFAKLKAKEPETAAMSKSEIQSWLNSTASPSSPGEESDEGLGWKRDRVLCDWEKSLEYAQDKLLRGKTKLRVEFLREELLSLAKHAGVYLTRTAGIVISNACSADLSLRQIMDIFRLLTQTYPKYNDKSSQDAVEEVGMAFVRRDETREDKFGVAEQIIGWLSNEVSQLVKRGTSK